MISRLIRTFVFAVLALSGGVRLFAQGGGLLTGVVKDSNGGVLPGVVVKVTDARTGTGAETTTNGDGIYATTALTAGTYRIEASLDGFETAAESAAVAASPATVNLTLSPSRLTESVVVTARRVEEAAQDVPIPVSVIRGDLVADAGAFNVNRMKEMLPTVQFYSTNPRNSTINIRGLGAPFGLTNDGIEPGVGLYIDGVFFARPASASLDFLDVEQVEVLRGPQGTLFGKNTTAGAVNVTTRRPAFAPQSEVEVNLGDRDFVQAKASVTGPLLPHVAGRLSFSGTRRDGTLVNVRTGIGLNDMNNVGVRGQLLFAPTDRVAVTLAVDQTRQRVEGNTQVVAGVAPTLRPANRQWPGIAADLQYAPPSYNAFDRLTDVDSPVRSYQDLGGSSLNVDWTVGPGRLTATTSWRLWNWNPSNDRDFIGLPITTVSAGTSKQQQWTQEVRYAGQLSPRATFVAGAFYFGQGIDSNPVIKQEQGTAAARFLLAPSAAAATPGLLDGYGFNQSLAYDNTSAALFGQLEWSINDRLRFLPGLRLNYDRKKVDFDQEVYGGLLTREPALVALQQSVLAPQAYQADVDDTNLSGQGTVAFKVASRVNTYATYSTSFKSVGLNLNGLPTDAAGRPVLSSATVRPEDVRHFEAGIKTEPFRGTTANLTAYDTEIEDFQAQVVNAGVGVLRGYLANAKKVRVRGLEFDGTASLGRRLSIYAAAAYTDGRYISFPDAPPPLEETGGPQVKDISGALLPGISRNAVSLGGEYVVRHALLRRDGQFFIAGDTSYRSSFSSSATPSRYLVVDGYSLVNVRAGFRASDGWTVSFWSRNLFNSEYYDLLSAAPGNSGLIVGQPGDPRTVGVTLRLSLRHR
ncbi:MAG TPA: TonB-dependent receptor [Vicinamibacterales bacterium]|nr:TonB-dependent receptor [Vicinamibacterales bacterium]